MAILDSLRALVGRGTRYENATFYIGPTVSDVLGMSHDELYRTQPHLRTVVSFLARNIAQLPLQGFARVGDSDRRRVHDNPLIRALSRPNPGTTRYELLYGLIASLKVHDVAIWMLTPDPQNPKTEWLIWPIPYAWVGATGGGDAWAPAWLEIVRPKTGKRVILENVPGEDPQFLLFHGWDPADPAKWSSPIESLRQILAEQIQAWQYREQLWQRGGRVGTMIVRPAGAPPWSPEAREKFSRDWAAKWTGPDGPKAGGTPILEDGMELRRVGFNAREEEWVEAAKLSLATVAGVYHTSPTMVGILDNANFANVREFARMLYTDTLGPDLAMIEARINSFLVPTLGRDTDDLYVEFNIGEKLQGSFEEQAAVVSTSVGRPWMTADEARARFNMPALGGDAAQLVTPLNVLVGGQASPRDTGSQNRNQHPPAAKTTPTLARTAADAPLKVKAVPREQDEKLAREVLVAFFKRQQRAVMSRTGAKDPQWWDADRWNDELATDLYTLAMDVTAQIGKDTLAALGIAPDEYDVGRTAKFLQAVAASRAGAINSTTRDQIAAALAGDVGDDAQRSTVAGVFEQATESRADAAAVTLATTFAAFAVTEAGRQLARPQTTKTWVVTSANPRPSHAALAGQTVPIDEPFGNGMDVPGDPDGGADEVAGCSCVIELTIP